MIAQLVAALLARGIVTEGKGKVDAFNLSSIEPCHPAAIGKRVHLVGDSLVWPVLFLYPEYGETDFIQEFHEDSWFVSLKNLNSLTNTNFSPRIVSWII